MKERIKEILNMAGASAVGFAKAEKVDMPCSKTFTEWLSRKGHADMQYMKNHPDIRRNPCLLLDGAKTIISIAFNYYPKQQRSESLPYISMYAYGKDYHDVLRKRLSEAVRQIQSEFGGNMRICIDSAPIHERYWAWKAGLGFQGLNGTLILPGKGSFFFLSEIVTTLEISPDTPLNLSCAECRKCVEACPGGALKGDCTMNANRCLSFLTIECRQEWDASGFKKLPLFGCDICQRVCPHNRHCFPSEISEFIPSKEMLSYGSADYEKLTEDGFKMLFRDSPVKRAKFEGFKRNLKNVIKSEIKEQDNFD